MENKNLSEIFTLSRTVFMLIKHFTYLQLLFHVNAHLENCTFLIDYLYFSSVKIGYAIQGCGVGIEVMELESGAFWGLLELKLQSVKINSRLFA